MRQSGGGEGGGRTIEVGGLEGPGQTSREKMPGKIRVAQRAYLTSWTTWYDIGLIPPDP